MKSEGLQEPIYGRSALLDELQQAESPVLIMAGDSGVGKSTALRAAQRAEISRVAPTPIEFRHAEGALMDGLLRSLGAGLVELESSQSALQQIDGFLDSAMKRIAKAGPKALGEVVLRELVEVIKGRLGPNVGEATRDFLKELRDVDPSLGARIAAVRDPSLPEVLADLLHELHLMAGGGGVVLSLDRGELLDEADWRILTDLAERLQTPVQIRIAISISGAGILARVENLTAVPSVGRLDVSGLSVDAVRLWMTERGIDVTDAERVWKLTRGYAFYVADALARLESGLTLEDLSLSEQVKVATEHEWDQLDVDVRTAARKLAVLAEPLPESGLQALCGVDQSHWQELVRALTRCHIFTTDVEGIPWFHELRRRHIELVLLSADERQSAAAAALLRLLRLVTESDDVTRLRELGRLAAVAVNDPSVPSDVRSVAALDRDMLCVAGALIEMSDPRSDQGAVVADQLITYARHAFPDAGDLVEAVERFAQESDLVAFASNERAAVVVPRWSTSALAALMGRVSFELRRLPIPALATAFFELTLRQRLGEFEVASYGIGNPSVASILRPIQRPLTREDGVVVIRDYEADPALVARFRVGERTLYIGVRYRDPEHLASAADSLVDLPWRFLDHPVVVREVNSEPEGRVPYLLFANALNMIEGVEGRFDSYGRSRNLQSQGGSRDGDYGAVKHTVIQVVREMATDHERRAFDLDEVLSIITAEDRDALFEYQVRGGAAESRRLNSLPIGFGNDPYWTYRIASMLNLQPDEAVVKVQASYGSRDRDPIVEGVADLAERARVFNRTQPRRRVQYVLEELAAGMQAARRREREFAQHLIDAIQPLGRNLSLRPARRLEAHLGRPVEYGPDSFWGPGCWWVEYPSSSGEEEVTVEWQSKDVEPPKWGDDPDDSRLASGMSVSADMVVQWLGFADDDANLKGHLLFPWKET